MASGGRGDMFRAGALVKPLAVFVAVAAVVALAMHYAVYGHMIGIAKDKVRNILLTNRGLHHYIQRNMHPAYYEAREAGLISPEFYDPEMLSSSYMVRTINAYYNVERIRGGLPAIYYKMAANNPRNPVNKADAHESRLIEVFNMNPDLKEFEEVIEVEGGSYLYYAIPFLRNEARCMKCHGSRGEAPPGLQARYPGQGGFGERLGEIRAIESIRVPIEDVVSRAYIQTGSVTAGAMALLILVFFNARLREAVRDKTGHLESEILSRERAEQQKTLLLSSTGEAIYGLDESGICTFCNPACIRMLGYEGEEELLGQNMHQLIHHTRADGSDYPVHECRIHEALSEGRGTGSESEVMWRKDGSSFAVEYWSYPMMRDGRVVGAVVTFIDITQRKKHEAVRAALLGSTRAILNVNEFSSAAKIIFDSCKRILGATAGYVALLSENGQENEVLFLDAGGRECRVDTSVSMPVRGLRAEAYRTGHTVYENDFMHSEWYGFMPHGHVRLDNVMFAPLIIEGRTVGIMGLANKEGGFNQEDAQIATSFGELSAIALKNSLAHDRIVTSLKEKEVLLKEVHHRVKNNMAIISALHELQSAHIEDEAARRLFLDSRSRVRSMALVHEKLYQSDNLAGINVPDYIESLVKNLIRSYAQNREAVAVDYDVAPMRLGIDTLIPLGLIVTELVTNSLKYALAGRPGMSLHIALKRADESGRMRLTVLDDGPGLPPGLDIETAGSLGLELVGSLVMQLGGKARMYSAGGACVEINLEAQELD